VTLESQVNRRDAGGPGDHDHDNNLNLHLSLDPHATAGVIKFNDLDQHQSHVPRR